MQGKGFHLRPYGIIVINFVVLWHYCDRTSPVRISLDVGEAGAGDRLAFCAEAIDWRCPNGVLFLYRTGQDSVSTCASDHFAPFEGYPNSKTPIPKVDERLFPYQSVAANPRARGPFEYR